MCTRIIDSRLLGVFEYRFLHVRDNPLTLAWPVVPVAVVVVFGGIVAGVL